MPQGATDAPARPAARDRRDAQHGAHADVVRAMPTPVRRAERRAAATVCKMWVWGTLQGVIRVYGARQGDSAQSASELHDLAEGDRRDALRGGMPDVGCASVAMGARRAWCDRYASACLHARLYVTFSVGQSAPPRQLPQMARDVRRCGLVAGSARRGSLATR